MLTAFQDFNALKEVLSWYESFYRKRSLPCEYTLRTRVMELLLSAPTCVEERKQQHSSKTANFQEKHDAVQYVTWNKSSWVQKWQHGVDSRNDLGSLPSSFRNILIWQHWNFCTTSDVNNFITVTDQTNSNTNLEWFGYTELIIWCHW